jgi:hypothetical protein
MAKENKMARSVSVPSEAVQVVYRYLDDEDDEYAYDYEVEYIQDVLEAKYGSLQRCSKWVDREDRAILENKLVYVGVSCYCGLLALWVLPKDNYPELAANWGAQINLKEFADLRKVAAFSNGEALFERV